jgi:hypothetical protein
MKTRCLMGAVAMLTAGCSPLLYPGAYSSPAAGRTRSAVASPSLPVGRWDNVMRLPRLAVIDVLTRDGIPTVGGFSGADAVSVRVDVGGTQVEIARDQVIRIDLVAPPRSQVRAAVRGAVGGALLGAGAAALFAGVIGGEAWPPPGPLVRIGAAQGGLTGASSAISERQGRLIYLARGY